MRQHTTLLLAAWVGLLGGWAVAQQSSPVPGANTIAVSAQGEFQAQPDTARVQLEVSGQNASLKAAYAQAQAQAEQVRALLRQQGLAPEQAHWSGYNMQPNMDYKTRRVTDYTVSASLQLELTDFAKIGPLLDAFGAAGVNALRGVGFELKKMDAAKAAAIADGYRQAHMEAEALAQAAGRKIQRLDSASVDVSAANYLPQPRMMAMASLAAAPAPTAEFSPHTITVSARISAVYRLEP